jgi:signal transduction histidine kinase
LIAARDESDRLYSILSDLLDISRIEAGKIQMELRSISPHELVLKQVESLHATARDRGVSLRAQIPPGLPDVMADPERVAHVLANLLSNAIKYTSAGGEVTISAAEENEVVRFLVSDTGRGIPAEFLDRVFDQFFRVPGQEITSGEGLGLTIAREIVEAHGGTMSVESREGKGSVFSFSLKRADKFAQKH